MKKVKSNSSCFWLSHKFIMFSKLVVQQVHTLLILFILSILFLYHRRMLILFLML